MTFSRHTVTEAIQGLHQPGLVKIAGEDFPGFGTSEEKVERLERAVIALTRGIEVLAEEVERLSRLPERPR